MEKYTDGSGLAVVTKDAIPKFLMCKRGDGLGWCIPGGKRDIGDKDFLDTAIRECREETGYDFSSASNGIFSLGTIFSVAKGRMNFSHLYLLLAYDPEIFNTHVRDKEMEEVRFIPITEIFSLDNIFPTSVVSLNTALRVMDLSPYDIIKSEGV